MSGIALAVLTNGPAILSFIQQLVSVGTDAVTAWDTVKPMVANDVPPTHEQWVQAGLDVDAAHAQVQQFGTL